MKVLVTGGSGFIGSNFVRHLLNCTQHSIVNVDKLTYAANPISLQEFDSNPKYCFHRCDIVDAESLAHVFQDERPDAVVHLAAESHVDRSIDVPADFIQTNVVGTFNLLNCAFQNYQKLGPAGQRQFRFVHVSTDEVYGSLALDEHAVVETAKYAPSSPYSASKAGSDHLALAWNVTYGLPVIVTHSANNYGAFQYPEKLIPTIISKAVCDQPIPVYGDGKNIRDWLHVDDHCIALVCVLENGIPGQTYNIGANNERSNNHVVQQICSILDEFLDHESTCSELIEFVTDRKGHDFRYALDTSKIKSDLGWVPKIEWETGLRDTVKWYLHNRDWWQAKDTNQDSALLQKPQKE